MHSDLRSLLSAYTDFAFSIVCTFWIIDIIREWRKK